MNIDERKIRILQAIIHDYINTGEPIGSRTIAKKYDLGISSATIRNEMSDLEDMGYLEQLHSSSGRKPSDKGYRLYVDEFMQLPKISPEDELTIQKSIMDLAIFQMDKAIQDVTELLSQLTKLTCVVKAPSLRQSYIKHIQLTPIDGSNVLLTIVTDTALVKNAIVRLDVEIDNEWIFRFNNYINEKLRYKTVDEFFNKCIYEIEQELENSYSSIGVIISTLAETLIEIDESQFYLGGATNIFNYQEYNDIDNARKFLSLLDDKEKIRLLLNEGLNPNKVSIKIGTENFIEGAEDCSIISAVYSINNRPLGAIGIIGPTRMHYPKVISILREVIKTLNKNSSDNLNK
ncbi:heat-inducible transcriptional repressor HrcA [Haloimpatiens lingqiaonensis]|uniref:heat-inducible transcriptional repressor HrcA n=1 Tax=Haloimpatiens lingqiaonensis TaxID=1380675 RepID=UPI0010FD922C|nr:heat-inducible transcriptional repressor HrcA [Haloimpatiens lingqiaonensis]